ncbi:hypothetical protein RHGRI_003714 [Rhododendron griersonianum]|uniref:S-protein homolog n=1 Tax=Rhododendron griersonianum TaxID=479676 RepID=A0AAV6L8Z9_9ERIC|nr:hypothetical protein RHGRI_003714 [Rhododendron griersonianum]
MAHSSLLLLIVTFHLVCTQTLCKQQYFQFFKRVTVHVINGVPGVPDTLQVHCQSKDDDLGTHGLKNGQEINWTFKPNLFDTTLFFCHFLLGFQGQNLCCLRSQVTSTM